MSEAKKIEATKFEAPTLKKAEQRSNQRPVQHAEVRPQSSAASSPKPELKQELKTEDLRSQLKRRRVPRRPIENRVGLLHKGKYSVTWAYEIGEGGMLISTPLRMDKDDRIVITLRIADVFEGVLIGKIVHLYEDTTGDQYRYGIQFEEVDFEMRRKIRNFVAAATTYVV